MLEERVGKLTVQREKFDHTGIAHMQHENGTIESGQNRYIEQLRRTDDSETRGQAENAALPPELTSAFLSLLGGISWRRVGWTSRCTSMPSSAPPKRLQ